MDPRVFLRPCVLFTVLLLSGCQGKRTYLPDFHSDQWKSDPKGCEGIRASMRDEVNSVTASLRGLSENDILDILGTPDENELYKRNQKFYVYHITPAASCNKPAEKTGEYLEIRFSATNMASEVQIMEE